MRLQRGLRIVQRSSFHMEPIAASRLSVIISTEFGGYTGAIYFDMVLQQMYRVTLSRNGTRLSTAGIMVRNSVVQLVEDDRLEYLQ